MAFIVGLIATTLVVPLMIRVSPKLGLVDHPGSDPLKIHQLAVPRSGGLAVAVGLASSMFVVRPSVGWIVGAVGALGLGIVDDRAGLSPRFRFFAEVVVAAATSILLTGTEDWLRVALGVIVIVVAINAANLFDGLDGLFPGAGFLTAIGLALLLAGSARLWMWALAGCLAGFLVYNRPPARIFLGDSGAYLVGVTLGVGLLELSSSPSRFLGGMVAFGLIGVDFVVTLLRRWRKRHPLFTGDRSHLYDQMLDRGWPVWPLLLMAWGVQAGLVGMGLLFAELGPVLAATAAAVTFAVTMYVLWRLGFFNPQTTS